MVSEARSKQTVELLHQDVRVTLQYKKGRKTYSDECLGGVDSYIGSHALCCKSSTETFSLLQRAVNEDFKQSLIAVEWVYRSLPLHTNSLW